LRTAIVVTTTIGLITAVEIFCRFAAVWTAAINNIAIFCIATIGVVAGIAERWAAPIQCQGASHFGACAVGTRHITKIAAITARRGATISVDAVLVAFTLIISGAGVVSRWHVSDTVRTVTPAITAAVFISNFVIGATIGFACPLVSVATVIGGALGVGVAFVTSTLVITFTIRAITSRGTLAFGNISDISGNRGAASRDSAADLAGSIAGAFTAYPIDAVERRKTI